jgi:hypothetical protein
MILRTMAACGDAGDWGDSGSDAGGDDSGDCSVIRPTVVRYSARPTGEPSMI